MADHAAKEVQERHLRVMLVTACVETEYRFETLTVCHLCPKLHPLGSSWATELEWVAALVPRPSSRLHFSHATALPL